MVKEKIAPQYFPLPKPIINYLCDSADYVSMRKLYKSCKYFYSKCQLSLINGIGVYEQSEEKQYSLPKKVPIYFEGLIVTKKELDLIKFRLWITDSLVIFDATSQLVSRIVKCDVKELSIGCKITYPELKHLAESGNIKHFSFWPDYISHDDVILLEDIFELIPKANWIVTLFCKITKETMKKLLLLKHQTKIKTLVFKDINERLEVKLLDQFLKVNLADSADHFSISFVDKYTNELLLKKIVENISSWTSEKQKPKNFPDIESTEE